MEALLLPTVNNHLRPSADQHDYRPGHYISTLLQLTSDIATGFNKRKPPHRTVCIAVDMTAAFDSRPQRIVIKDCKINTAGGDLSMAVKLFKRQTISYQLQRCQVKGKESTARL